MTRHSHKPPFAAELTRHDFLSLQKWADSVDFPPFVRMCASLREKQRDLLEGGTLIFDNKARGKCELLKFLTELPSQLSASEPPPEPDE